MSKFILSMLFAAAALAVSCNAQPEPSCPAVQYKTPKGGKLDIYMITHGSVAMSYKGFSVQVDPVGKMGQTEFDYTQFPKADLILITHEHGDHLSADTIELLSKDDTQILLNAKSRDQLGKGEAIANGESRKVGPVGVTAVPAYNISEGRQNFHPKGNGNGYILDFDGFKVYVAGDTEDIDEMASFGPVDVAFLPVNQPYTMTTTQCIEAALTLKPKVLIPYHMSQTDIQEVKTVLDANDSGIEVLLFEELR
jgi:L-ascorbate metabolism protein UlaG (beta-lactamase superfamily)